MSRIYDWLLGQQYSEVDAHETDPALLKEHSDLKTYTTSRFQYQDIRVFYRPHAEAAQLPKEPAPLPLLVCIPGLGGSVAQFHSLLKCLINIAPCLAIDHPGGGRSAFSQKHWDAYDMEALVELLEVIIEDHRNKDARQKVVLIGHSMGTGLSAMLASQKMRHTTDLVNHIVGLVAICPSAAPLGEKISYWVHRLLWVPGWAFSLWRLWDDRGGPNSASVARFVGDNTCPELCTLQYRFNQQSRTAVFRRMLRGAVPVYAGGQPRGGMPTTDAWSELEIPLYLIGGEADHITPTQNINEIVNAIRSKQEAEEGAETLTAPANEFVDNAGSPLQVDKLATACSVVTVNEDDIAAAKSDAGTHDSRDGPPILLEAPAPIPAQPDRPATVVRFTILPAPANHTLLYAPELSQAVANLIADFLANNVTGRLSLAWQLKYLSRTANGS